MSRSWPGFWKIGFAALGVVILVIIIIAALAVVQFARWEAAPRYHIGFVNETGHNLRRVELRFGRVRNAGPRGLVKGGYSTFGFVTEPIPAESLVTWDEESIHHEVTVKLEGVVPPGFTKGTIYFILKPDGSVSVKTADFKDRKANQEILKNLPDRRDLANP